VEGSDESASASTLREYFAGVFPKYLKSWELAVETLAAQGRWKLVGEGLNALANSLPDLSPRFLADAVWWALRSEAAVTTPEWLKVLQEPLYGLADGNAPITAFLSVARARGWEEIANEPGDIADGVYAAYGAIHPHDDTPHLTRLLFRAAAFIGRIRRVATRSGWVVAGEVVTESQAAALLDALWNRDTIYSSRFRHGHIAPSLAAELSAICLKLPVKFADRALASALPHASKFPVDSRRRALWRVLEHHGRRDLLCEWVRHWLDSEGAAWKTASDERTDIVRELVPLARDLGENSIADAATERMCWSQVGYRSEERSFDEAVRWLRELCRLEPSSWKQEGWALWSLADICEQQFCSVNASAGMEEAISAAAIRGGPQDLWRLLAATLPKKTDRKWHYETRNRLGAGFGLAIRDGMSLSVKDRLTLWTFSTGILSLV
jgi:hypothetical protein